MKKSTESIRNALALAAASAALYAEIDSANQWEDAFEQAATAAYDAAHAAEDGERMTLYRYAEACERGARACLVFAHGAGLIRAALAAREAAEALGDLPRLLRETEPEPRAGDLRLHPHQRGAYFVASYRTDWSFGRGVTLYRNGHPVAAAETDGRSDGGWRLVPPSPRPVYPCGPAAHAAAKAAADQLRAALRALPAATRREIVRCYWGECDFVPLGGGWEYIPGQEGGCLRLPAQGPALEHAWGNGCAPMFVGAGRAVRDALDPDFTAYAAELCETERRAAEAAAREAAARRADAAVAQARALRASFGDRCAL